MRNIDGPALFAIAIIFGGLAVIAGFTLLWLVSLQRRLKKRAKPGTTTPKWIIGLLIVVFLTVFISSFGGRKNRPRPGLPAGPAVSSVTVGWVVGASFLFLFGYVGVVFVRASRKYRDRDAILAFKRAQSGDVDGAIADLRTVIEERGPSGPLSNTMGLLHSMKEEWTEALDRFAEAVKAGGREPLFLKNQGMILMKLGRPEEAVATFLEAKSLTPTLPNSDLDIHVGQALVALGRLDEARQHLAMAEAFHRRILTVPPSAKHQVGAMIEELRQKIADHPKAGGRSFFDEL